VIVAPELLNVFAVNVPLTVVLLPAKLLPIVLDTATAFVLPVPNVLVVAEAPEASVELPVEDNVVNAPVLAVVAPTVVPLIEPPVILKFEPLTWFAFADTVPPNVVAPFIWFVLPAKLEPIVLATATVPFVPKLLAVANVPVPIAELLVEERVPVMAVAPVIFAPPPKTVRVLDDVSVPVTLSGSVTDTVPAVISLTWESTRLVPAGSHFVSVPGVPEPLTRPSWTVVP
jgi:hypothetical protein